MGIDPAEDMEVRALLGDARSVTIKFATAEWIDLSPDLTIGLEETLRELAPGEMLGSAFPPAPSASSQPQESSGLSGRPVPPMSHNPSSSSGVSRPAAPPPTVAVAAQRKLFVSGPGERPADWLTVRHSLCDFPVLLDSLLPSACAAGRGISAACLPRPLNLLTPLVILVWKPG